MSLRDHFTHCWASCLFINGKADFFSLGKRNPRLLPLSITKILESQVAKLLLLTPFTWPSFKGPGRLSLLVATPVLPKWPYTDFQSQTPNQSQWYHSPGWGDEGVAIMGHQMRDSFCVHRDLSHLAQLILGLLECNMINNKVTFGVPDQMEILSSCQCWWDPWACRVGCAASDSAINLSAAWHADLSYSISYQDVLKPVP